VDRAALQKGRVKGDDVGGVEMWWREPRLWVERGEVERTALWKGGCGDVMNVQAARDEGNGRGG